MTITCTSTVHHGDTLLTVTAEGANYAHAFAAAVAMTDVGYRPQPANTEGGLRLLRAHQSGVEVPRQSNYAYYDTDLTGQPRIQIGWVDFTFVPARVVKLWAITAQVEVRTISGYTSSRQVPTFYLDPSVQMILNAEGAKRVAEDILSTAGPVDDLTVTLHVTADPVY